MYSAIAGRHQSRYLPSWTQDKTQDGRVAKNENGDRHDESQNE